VNTRMQIPAKPRTAPHLASEPFVILRRKCACGGSGGSAGECTECAKKKLQRRASGRGPETAPPIVNEVLRSPGQPLDAPTRAFFELRFGHDFSKVRVHSDARANESARAVNAFAYTVGRDIVFSDGLYNVNNRTGQQLLAHELTHVVQQQGRSHTGNPLRVGPSTDPCEREAEHATSAAAGGEAFSSAGRASGMIQRQEDDAPTATSMGRPVFFCSKSVALGFSHAFFRVGGPGPGNSTFELEHDENGDHCPCGIQGLPTRDYPEDRDSSDASCISAPAISESCLIANWSSYPVGKYCALGPNSNGYARFLAESCGATGLRPPGRLPGFSDAPPRAGTANPALDARITILPGGCQTINCDDQSCKQAPPF
jgi:hypothetical protein